MERPRGLAIHHPDVVPDPILPMVRGRIGPPLPPPVRATGRSGDLERAQVGDLTSWCNLSLGPALVSLHLEDLWVYLATPALGAALAVLNCRCIHERPCCCARESYS